MQEIDKRNPIYRRKQLKTTTFSMAIFVAIALILSGFAGAVVIQGNSTQMNENSKGNTVTSEALLEPTLDMARVESTPILRSDILQYDDGVFGTAFASAVGDYFSGANRFTPTELAGLDGKVLEAVQFAHFCYPGDPQTDIGEIQVYDEGTDTAPGALLSSEPFSVTSTGYYTETWHEIVLSTPVTIDESKDIWLCVFFEDVVSGTYPFATDGAPNYVGKSLWFSVDYGATWDDLTASYTTYNWMLRGRLEDGGGILDHDVGIKSIDSPETGPASENMPVEVTVKNYGNNTEIDVPVKVEIFKQGSSTPVNILPIEGFESGFPPAGWTVTMFPGYFSTWMLNTMVPRPNMASGMGDCAAIDSDMLTPAGGELITPAFSLVGMNTAEIEFDAYYQSLGDFFAVDVSPDGGSTWFNELFWTSSTSGLINIDLTAYVGNANVMVKFIYDDGFGWNWYAQVDNVVVNGVIILPGTLEYLDIEYVTLPVGGEETIEFADFTPDDWQVAENTDLGYDIVAQTIYADDNPSNDLDAESFDLSFPFLHDTAVISVDSPVTSGDATTFPVEATIKNVGQFPSCCYLTNAMIGEVIPGAIIIDEDFSVNYWTTTHPSNWAKSYTSSAGGASPEYRFSWTPSATADFRLYDSFNTVGISAATLSFKHYVNDYNGAYDLAVETSTDGMTWNEVWTVPGGPMGPETVEIDLTSGDGLGSATFYISFTFKGYSYNINYWFVDDVLVQESATSAPEYDEDVAAIILDPGEEAAITWPDWTPDHLATGISAFDPGKEYMTTVTSYNVDDTNPLNDAASAVVELDFYHEVLVQSITQPSMSRAAWDLLFNFDLEVASGALGNAGCEFDGTHFYSTRWAANLIHQYDITGALVKEFSIPGVSGLRDLTYNENTGYFYGGAAGGTIWEMDFDSETLIGSITGGFQARAIAYNPDDDVFYCSNFADPMWVVDASSGAILDTITLGVTSTYGMAYDNGPDGKFLYIYDQGAGYNMPQLIHQWDLVAGAMTGFAHDTEGELGIGGIAGGLAISGGFVPGKLVVVALYQGTPDMMGVYELRPGGGGPGAGWPPIAVWMQSGTASVEAIVANDGTFGESGLVCSADILEFISDPENGSEVYNDSIIGIDLDPLGDTETCTFTSYNFAMEGPYGLYIEMPLGTDDFPNNNAKAIGIGIDNTAPTCAYVKDPAVPNGENDWYTSDLTVTFTADDGDDDWDSGVKEIKYRVDGGPVQTIAGFTGSYTHQDDGDDIEIEYWAIDNVDNEGTHLTFDFDMDQTVPDVDIAYEVTGGSALEGWDFVFTATATDDMSGMDRVVFYLNDVPQETVPGPGPTYQWGFKYYGQWEITIRAEAFDDAGLSASDQVVNPESSEYSQSLPSQVVTKKVVGLGQI